MQGKCVAVCYPNVVYYYYPGARVKYPVYSRVDEFIKNKKQACCSKSFFEDGVIESIHGRSVKIWTDSIQTITMPMIDILPRGIESESKYMQAILREVIKARRFVPTQIIDAISLEEYNQLLGLDQKPKSLSQLYLTAEEDVLRDEENFEIDG
jgi:hypothetical protein